MRLRRFPKRLTSPNGPGQPRAESLESDTLTSPILGGGGVVDKKLLRYIDDTLQQHATTYYHTLQHTATHYNTL